MIQDSAAAIATAPNVITIGKIRMRRLARTPLRSGSGITLLPSPFALSALDLTSDMIALTGRQE
jgi:hypothetical protein